MAQKQHELKAQQKTFEALKKVRNYDVRKNDRQFAVGDKIVFREWLEKEGYTWRVKFAIVTSVTPLIEVPGFSGDISGYCVLGLKFQRK